MARTLTKTSVPGVYRRGKSYIVVLRDDEGRQFKRCASSMAEARDLRSTLSADKIRGELPSTRRLTLGEYFDQWRGTYRGRSARGIRTETLADYMRAMEREVIPVLGHLQLSEVAPSHIKQLASQLADEGLANNTVRLRIAPLRAMLATAVEDGFIRANPAAGFRNVYGVRTQDEIRSKALSDAQLQRLLTEIPEHWQQLIRFLAEAGLRIGEAAELRWRDVDTAARRINVQRRYYRGNVDAPKSRFGVRSIPLTEEMADALGMREGMPNDLVFTTESGTRLDSCILLSRIYKPAAARAGVPWATIHSLRHTCASRLFRNGWNAKQVQMMLGHHSPAFTLATYVHLMPDDLPMPVPVAVTMERGS